MTDTYRLGPVTLAWEMGDLRYLRLGRVELLRRVYGAVRDTTWGTVPAQVELLTREEADSEVRLTWRSTHRDGNIAFTWQGSLDVMIEMNDGRARLDVTYAFDGQADTAFATNRTGICVLHPLVECAGQPARVYHPDGTMTDSLWPELIAPEQPLRDIHELLWWPSWLAAHLVFAGEVFECEDQRNWSDGSFKTYSRPLSQPFPYPLAAGERVRQSMTLTVVGVASPADGAVAVSLGEPIGPMPLLGLRGDVLDYERVEVGGRQSRAAEPSIPGAPREVALHLPANGPGDLAGMARQLADQPPARVIVYRDGMPCATADDVALVCAVLGDGLPIGAGTIGSFAELNRARPVTALLAWPICPQVHATDDQSLIENLQGIAATVATARKFAPGAVLCVGPLLFWRRPDPFAAGCSGIDDGSAPPDERLRGPLGALWTLGALAALAQAGVDAVTLYDADGPYALADGALLTALASLRGGTVLRATTSDPLQVTALAVRVGGDVRCLLGNLGAEPVSLVLDRQPLVLAGHEWRLWEGRSLG